jgi:SanA protein
MRGGGRIGKYLRYISAALIVAVLFTITIYETISTLVADAIFENVNELPHNRVGLLPGTSKYLMNGRKNLFFAYRIRAAVELYKKGKIDYILVSGDNSTPYYNEPVEIKKELMGKGVPDKRIYLDYAGFRTLDSILRAKEIFGLSKFTVISQKFHNERALFLAKHHGIEAIAYNAADVGFPYGLRTHLREYPARVMALLDIIFATQPKFGGEKIRIE